VAQINDKEYAAYMLANYALGYIDTALFIGANLFEKYFKTIISKEEASGELRKGAKQPVLYHYIEAYIKYKYKDDVLYSKTNNLKLKLHMFRNLRNDFIHDMNENKIIQEKSKIGEFILYIYFSYNRQESYDSTIIFESVNNTLLQDYKIKEITERMIARMEKEKIPFNSENVRTFKGIKKSDFNNLFELRKKLRYLQRNLEKDMSEVGLVSTILSPIDTTSAYIWMPFIDKEFTDNINKFHTKRGNLVVGSTSILATPVDFRIYIDFGGGDYEYRLAFHNFILSNEFKSCIQQLGDQELYLEIFDIKWYSFITHRCKLNDVLEDDSLITMSSNAKEIIKKEQEKENIITSGYNKIGYILPDRDIGKNEIYLLFKNIAYIYYEFLIYKFKDDPDVHILKQAQSTLFK
jgi:hypothetical protein